MGHTPHLSRREVIRSIPLLGSGALLLPLTVLQGQRPDTSTPAVIRGALRDQATGKPVAAKIRVTESGSGVEFMPSHAIRTMPRRTGPGAKHYFYARGQYEIALPPGRYQLEVVRGLCHDNAVAFTEVGAGITHVVDFDIPLLQD